MNDLAIDQGDAAFVHGLPRLDRYFPQCTFGAIEGATRLRFRTNDFGKIYGRHTFRYHRPPGPIHFRANGVELDIEFYREEVRPGELEALVESIYGIRISKRSLVNWESYWEYCRRELKRGSPVVTDFDLFGIKERREYRKLRSPHTIVLTGYDRRSGTLTAGEMMIGTISIDDTDFRDCIQYKLETSGGVDVYELTRVEASERELSRTEVIAQIDANLQNLNSLDDTCGLRALQRFRDELGEYVHGPDFDNRPFSIPGLWVFSHERHIERKWLRSARAYCPAGENPLCDRLDATLERLFKAWLNCDFLMEKCLNSGNGKALRTIPEYLEQIIADERRVSENWEALRAAVAHVK